MTRGIIMGLDSSLRKELAALLRGGNAHMGFDEAVSDFPMKDINREVPNAGYRVWHVLEHMRIVQWDILEFVRDPGHVSPEFPGGYWPKPNEEATPDRWEKIVKDFRRDLKAIEKIVKDPRTDFFSPLPHAPRYTIFREVLLAADHNASHLGEFVTLRRVLDMNPVGEY